MVSDDDGFSVNVIGKLQSVATVTSALVTFQMMMIMIPQQKEMVSLLLSI